MYADGPPAGGPARGAGARRPLPFVFEATGAETRFTNGFDPVPRARARSSPSPGRRPSPRRCATPRPTRDARPGAPRSRAMPRAGPRACARLRSTRSTGVERSLAEQPPDRSLVQMATGAGKTFTAVTATYRLLQHAGVRRVLFLVDRNNLGDQTLTRVPELRARPTTAASSPSSTTSQRSRRRDARLDARRDLHHPAAVRRAARRGRARRRRPEARRATSRTHAGRGRATTPSMPPETFDLVIVDECHRSIYGMWRGGAGVLRRAHRRADRHARSKQTFGFFQQNLVASTPTRSRWPTASTSTSTSTGSGPRSASRADGRGRHRRPGASTGAPAASATRRSTTTSTYSAQPARPRGHRDATRSALVLETSATGCSPRSSPAARRCRRR